MSDPVIEAAQRAWVANEALDGIAYSPGEGGLWTPDAMEAAAREALRPIRELHYPRENSVSAMYPDPLCNCDQDWPCETAKLIYTTEEIQ